MIKKDNSIVMRDGNKKIKYIIIGQGQEWCYYSWKSVSADDRIVFYKSAEDRIGNNFWGKLCIKHLQYRDNKGQPLPFRNIWYKRIVSSLQIDPRTKYIIFYDWGVLARDLNLIDYIKSTFPELKLVYLFSNTVKVSGAKKYNTLNKLLSSFDQVFAFEKEDALEYGFDCTPLIYTRDIDYIEEEKDIDVFYVGNAKDRINILHEIYEKCIEAGLKCTFYINGVSKDEQLYPDIHYNMPLSYKDVLHFMARSRCMVDAIQGGGAAMTIKVCETVIYDKKLITTNKKIVEEAYYSNDSFLLYNSDSNLEQFVKGPIHIFTEDDKNTFSPYRFLDRLIKSTD